MFDKMRMAKKLFAAEQIRYLLLYSPKSILAICAGGCRAAGARVPADAPVDLLPSHPDIFGVQPGQHHFERL